MVLRRPLTPTSDRYSKLTMREGDVVDVSYMLWNKQDDKDDEGFVSVMNQEWLILNSATTMTAYVFGLAALALVSF